MISISGHDAYVLVDPSATHSFVFENFATNRDLKLHALKVSMIVHSSRRCISSRKYSVRS